MVKHTHEDRLKLNWLLVPSWWCVHKVRYIMNECRLYHCVKSIQNRVFPVEFFHSFLYSDWIQENMDQKKLRWTLFMQHIQKRDIINTQNTDRGKLPRIDVIKNKTLTWQWIRLVIQWANCAGARRLKCRNEPIETNKWKLVDLTWSVVVPRQ